MPKRNAKSRYDVIVERIFSTHFRHGQAGFEFTRDEFEDVARKLGIDLPKNLGDVLYSFRYRKELPESIRSTASQGLEWVVEGAGKARYRFRQVRINRIEPRRELIAAKIPDATPEIVAAYAQTDKQALLAKVRYNRLIDIFLGIASYSLQNHLRTTVDAIGQIEIDEIYVGVDRGGRQFVVPVQAKGGSDKHGAVQTRQDIAFCREKYPQLICRPVSAQFMDDDRIALFELTIENGEVRIVEERHYRLVPAADISAEDLNAYSSRGDKK